MSSAASLWEGDAVHRSIAWALLLMSVASWVVMLWKLWLLQRVRHDLPRCVAAFWQAQDAAQALEHVRALDREAVLAPLVQAAYCAVEGPMAATAPAAQQRTRLLRNALHTVLHRLQLGQILLATVGAIAPFVGLLGTVWGIYHALVGIAEAGVSLEKIAGPVGESLVMTAAGLAVAIPAVLGYNVLGRWIARAEAELEGFARDVRDLVA